VENQKSNQKAIRPSRDEILLRTAELFSLRATCVKPNGAVIARDGRIISVGYCGSPPGQPHCTDVGCLPGSPEYGGCIRTTHAEANAIIEAARSGISTNGATLYCTSSPCYMCSKLIIGAGITMVLYRNEYRDLSGIRLMIESNIVIGRIDNDGHVSNSNT